MADERAHGGSGEGRCALSDTLNRREALKLLAAAPALGALSWTGAQLDRVASRLAGLADAAASYEPVFFTAHEYATVRLLVNDILPADERSGSASEAKVPEFMDVLMHDADTSDETRTAMRGGLAWIDLACDDRFGMRFVACPHAQRNSLLDQIAWPKRATPQVSQGAAFFTRFRDLTATGFFSSEMGWKDLRYTGNVAVPEWNGCPPAALEKLGVSYAIMDARQSKE